MTSPAPVSKSYMELCFHVERLIHGEGKDSFEIQNSFNKAIAAILGKGDDLAEEVFSMFQPLSYWEEMS